MAGIQTNGVFRDRVEAGQFLAPLLRTYARRDDVVVLALACGGVPVGFEIASRLHVPLAVLVMRDAEQPKQPATEMTASAAPAEHVALERQQPVYQTGRRPLDLQDKIVLLVDDGILTGATMRAAVRSVESKRPRSMVVAAPIVSAEAIAELKKEVAEVVAVLTPRQPRSLADFYGEWMPITEEEVQLLLTRAAGRSRDAGLSSSGAV